jgi:uncharacterized membrane protein SpoIIM required for sporulation
VNLEHLVNERAPQWDRLEQLLDLAERTRERDLGHERIFEMVVLYRQVAIDLNRIRSMTADPDLLRRLNQLTARAYGYIYGRKKTARWTTALRDLFLGEIPSTFLRERFFILMASIALLAGALVGAVGVATDPSNAPRLIPPQFFTESPRERVEAIETGDERIDSVGSALGFGAYLYTHNIRVALLAFSLGALTIVGGYWILFYNGVLLGAVATTYVMDGVTVFFLAWVGPHGSLEIPAILFGAAAGIRLGHAIWFPSGRSRRVSLSEVFPSVWRMLIATVTILVLAGLIEGGFSQFSSQTFPYGLKIGVAVVFLSLLVGYLFILPARKEVQGAP